MKNEFADWSDVRVFLAVFRSGSTLAAAETLGMSQPTVMRRLESLEHALGTPLFLRSTRGSSPTPQAHLLLGPAEEMERAALRLIEGARKARARATRVIRFTAPAPSFSDSLSGILKEFRAKHPGVEFELLSTPEVLDLREGQADVALRFAHEMTDPKLICTKLTDVHSAFFTSADYAARHGLPKGPEDIAGHRLVVIDSSRSTKTPSNWIMEFASPEQIVSRCSNVDTVVSAVKAGMGVGPIPLSLADDHKELEFCFDTPPETWVRSWLVMSAEAFQRPEVKAFASFFAPQFRKIFRREIRTPQ